MLRSWNLRIWEQMLVALSGYWRRLDDRPLGEVAVYQVVIDMNIAVRSRRCNDQKEWLLRCTPKTVFKEAIGLLGDDVCTVA